MPFSSQTPVLIDPPPAAETEVPLFLLPGPGTKARQRKGWSLVFSLGIQILGVLGLLWLVRFLPPPARFFYPISQRSWTVVRLEAPSTTPPPAPIVRKIVRNEVVPPPRHHLLPPVALPVPPRTAPEPRRQAPVPVATPAPRPGPSRPIELRHPVATAPPAAHPALKIAPPVIKVGSFGDPQGVTAPATAKTNAPRIGAFDGGDAPHGAVAPPSGARTGAFSALDGPPNPGVNAALAKVHVNSFDTVPAGTLHTPPPVRVPTPVSERPPVILSHPRPVYTPLAQRNHIEGEVVLQAVLQRDGGVRIVRVVQGLGYGLDQAARDAAQKLRFRPALRDGQPVNWTVLLHITFRLAY